MPTAARPTEKITKRAIGFQRADGREGEDGARVELQAHFVDISHRDE